MATAKEVGLRLNKDKLLKRTISILPKRDEYFMDLLNALKQKYPGIKLIYANNQMGAKLDPEHPNPDFVIIMTTDVVSSDPKLNGSSVTLIDAPLIFTERSIAGWTMAVEDNNVDGYFEFMIDKAVRISTTKFEEYLQYMCLLSLDPENSLYWKNPNNSVTLYKEIMELYSRYAQPGQNTKMAASKDYSRDAMRNRKKTTAISG